MKMTLQHDDIFNRKIIVFGTGQAAINLVQSLYVRVDYYVDNNSAKWGKFLRGAEIRDPEVLLQEDKGNVTIIIASMYFNEIASQLTKYGFTLNDNFFSIDTVLSQENSSQRANQLPYLDGAESSLSKRIPIQHFVKRLLQYDVISFDIFDTLILRPFSKPTDLFLILGQKHRNLSFAEIRYQVERDVRKESLKKNGTTEVTFAEIYEQIEDCTGIDQKYGMQIEFETELEYSFANPYMKEAFEILKDKNKKIIAISDMYLPRDLIERLLEKCGFTGFEEILVSSEYRCSKGDMGLFQIAEEKVVRGQRVIHVGDNYKSDIEKSTQYGWDNIYYPNVNNIGLKYRATKMSPLMQSAYSGVVNAHLHNGLKKYSPLYEFGFIYGGLFVLGFCLWIYKVAKNNNINQILFFENNCYLVKVVYDMLKLDIPSENVFWSETANLKTASRNMKFIFLKTHVRKKAKAANKSTVRDVLNSIEAGSLIPRLTQYNLDPNQIINNENYQLMEKFIVDHWLELMEIYKKNDAAAKMYFESKLRVNSKLCLVDTGLSGSAALGLKERIEEDWGLNCKVYGLLAASSEGWNIELLEDETIDSYLFSQVGKTCEWHGGRAENNTILEMFLRSSAPSFSGFTMKENKFEMRFDTPEVERYKAIREIQHGVIDFVKKYNSQFKGHDYFMNISAINAYAPIAHVTQNMKLAEKVLGDN